MKLCVEDEAKDEQESHHEIEAAHALFDIDFVLKVVQQRQELRDLVLEQDVLLLPWDAGQTWR